MADFRLRSQPAQAELGDVWRRTLAPIPTLFGRLHYVAGLKDPQTGRYTHPALAQAVGQQNTDQTLRESHRQLFGQWLALSLEEQKLDLEEFLSGSGRPPDPRRYRELAPPEAHEVERQLYLTDLETVLELLDPGRGRA
jgi:hypothetical protein